MFQLIASYPKSGNTYVRIFLAHYTRGETDLNKTGFPIFASKAHFPLGTPRRNAVPPFAHTILSKTHEVAYGFGAGFVDRALYLVRNPLDVAPSFARHVDCSLDQAIKYMGNASMSLRGTPSIYPQRVGSWSANVLSWLTCTRFPVCCVRYETLVASPAESFTEILKFFGIPIDRAKLSASLEFSSFQNLKSREAAMRKSAEEAGQVVKLEPQTDPNFKPLWYKEARGTTGAFFNVGHSGDWTKKLSREQIERILYDHGEVMETLGYANKTQTD